MEAPGTPRSARSQHTENADSDAPQTPRIVRKPLAPTHSESNKLLHEATDELTELRNPLAKKSFSITPDSFVSRPCTDTTVGDGSSVSDGPQHIHTYIARPKKRQDKLELAKQLWKELRAYWILDVAWVGVSLLCFIIIISVLHAFDGIALSRLPMAVTLNTFLAFFTTIAKAALLVPVAQAISQWKWNWFLEERPLSDFELFDNAGRSLWGSVMLLRQLTYKHVVSAGALLCVVSVLTSPINQLMIAYPQGHARMNGVDAVVYGSRTLQDNGASPIAPWDLQTAVINGMLAPTDSKVKPTSPNCASGDCTFPTLQSLGICTKISNITNLLTVSAAQNTSLQTQKAGLDQRDMANFSQITASLPDRANCFIKTPWSYAVVACKSLGTESVATTDESVRRAAIYTMPVIFSNGINASNPATNGSGVAMKSFQAVEVLFYLCVNSYDVKVLDGNATTVVKENAPTVVSGAPAAPFNVNCSIPVGGSTVGCTMAPNMTDGFFRLKDPSLSGAEADNPATHYLADVRTIRRLILAINRVTSGVWEWSGTTSGDFNEPVINMAGGTGIQTVGNALYGFGDSDPAKQFERISTMMENVATSLTNVIRTRPHSGSGDENKLEVQGTAWSKETIIHIRWGWITFMVLQYLTTIGFLLATVYSTHEKKGQVLKSSSLGALFALGEECRTVAGGIESVPAMLRKARVLQVRRDGEYIELVGQPQERKRTGTSQSNESRIECTTETVVHEEKL